jgi:alkylhydroperoxidase family enzyme
LYHLRNRVRIAPQAAQAVDALHSYVYCSSIEPRLQCLVAARVSRLLTGISDSSYEELSRAAGCSVPLEHVRRISAWQNSTCFDEREKAALAWSELVTSFDLANADAVFGSVASFFTDKEMIDLTLTIATANFDRCMALVVQT